MNCESQNDLTIAVAPFANPNVDEKKNTRLGNCALSTANYHERTKLSKPVIGTIIDLTIAI